MVDGGPCRDLPRKLAWDKTFRFTKRQKAIYTPIYPCVNKTVTKPFAIPTSQAAAAASADGDEWRNFATFIANKWWNYLPRTTNKVQHTISHNILGADRRIFAVSYPVCTPSPPSHVSPLPPLCAVSYSVCTPSPPSHVSPLHPFVPFHILSALRHHRPRFPLSPLLTLLLVQKTSFWVIWCEFRLCKLQFSY
jgi:hypothetical protein